ncbi:MAG: hypothetical protein KIT56_02370 [Gammaproteobacteria bacterium]|nr:hypothetical protein [Gammaproteobacteria bacterium]MCW5582723.1 hypothetical protein [Gammaproteobacteria bacterium]
MNKSKGKKMDFDSNWYDIWMTQSREFFESANKNLKDIFAMGAAANPEEHMKQINLWLETLKNQWKFTQFNEQQKAYEDYWKIMEKMYVDASHMMVQQWMQRTKEKSPIGNIRELYELWLYCCNEVYTKSMHSKSYQEAYGEFLNAAIHFWKSALPK